MTKKNKRPHKEDAKAATPTTSNCKKVDDKTTPTKSPPDSKDQEMTEITPTVLNFTDETANNVRVSDQNDTDKKIIHSGFTSTEWCASGKRCKNDKISATQTNRRETCLQCNLAAHPECLCEQECLTCNKHILWNSYTRRWIKVIPTTQSTNDSSLNKAVQASNKPTINTTTFGQPKWCGSKELCRNKNIPANDSYTCTICLDYIHSECINAGEKESDYICLGCNKKPTTLGQNDEPLSTTNNQSDTAIIFEDVDQPTNSPTSILQQNNNSDTEMLVNINDQARSLSIIEEEQQNSRQQEKQQKYPVAPGGQRITKNENGHNQLRPNRSTKKGDHFITRVELRVNVTHDLNNDENNLKKLHRHLTEILTKLKEIDGNVKVIPWKEQQEYAEVDATNIPNTHPGIKKFFNRITLRNEGHVYADMRLKHKRKTQH